MVCRAPNHRTLLFSVKFKNPIHRPWPFHLFYLCSILSPSLYASSVYFILSFSHSATIIYALIPRNKNNQNGLTTHKQTKMNVWSQNKKFPDLMAILCKKRAVNMHIISESCNKIKTMVSIKKTKSFWNAGCKLTRRILLLWQMANATATA